MFAVGWRSVIPVVLAGVLVTAAAVGEPVRHRRPVELLSTVEARYRLMQEDREIGGESFLRRTFDDNRVEFDSKLTTTMGGIRFEQRSVLVLEDESYFPSTFRTDKVIEQPDDTLRFTFTTDMFANVAVIGSEMRGRSDSRRLVVPVGIPIVEVGALYCWYPILFWVDFESQDRQRIQWLDPQSARIDEGEIYLSGIETIDVLGKKTPVSVFKVERERLGPAKLYVDSRKRIVRCEQNMNVFELMEWTEK